MIRATAIATQPLQLGDRRLATRGLQLFIVTIPFLHAFGMGSWLPLPMSVALLALASALATGGTRWIWIEKSDGLLLLLLICGCIPFLQFSEYAGQKNANHAIALTVTFAIFYIFMRAWIAYSQITLDQIADAATLALVIAASAVIAEFALVNTVGIYLADFIPYSADDLPKPHVLETLLRPRGLAAEPGFSAMVFEALIPLTLPVLRRQRGAMLLVAPLAIGGFLLLFSAGAIGSMLVAAALLLAAGRGAGLKILAWVVVIAVLVIVFAGSEVTTWLFDQVVGRKITDLLEGDAASGVNDIAGRYVAYRVAWDSFSAHPFGIGWGMISQIFASGVQLPDVPQIQSRGLLSLYLEILVAAGLPGLLLFVSFILRKVVRLARCAHPGRVPVLFGLVALAIHHMFVLEFWFPMLWFYLALSDVMCRRGANGDVATAVAGRS